MKIIFRLVGTFILTVIVTGCVSQYGPKGINGGYSDKRVNATSYFIRYDGPALVGGMVPMSNILPLWKQRAKELCGSDDYYSDYKELRLDGSGHETAMGTPAVVGYVYCNGNFVDSRKQEPEENYQRFIDIPLDKLVYTEKNPFWESLVAGRYAELEKALEKLAAIHEKNAVSDNQFESTLAVFGKINGLSDQYLSNWIKAYPSSAYAYYARAEFYMSIGWFKRGNATWDKVPYDSRQAFKKYMAKANLDIDKAIELSPGFCAARELKLDITRGSNTENEIAFDKAVEQCPKYQGIYASRLKSLLPRWGGSMDRMKQLIDSAAAKYPELASLQAMYLTEQGDQFLFKQKYEEALNKYNEALAEGEFSFVYHQRAMVLEELGRYVEASASYKNSIALSPYYTSSYEGLGRTLLKQNDFFGALLAASILTQLNNQNAQYFSIQGDLLYRIRRYQDALIDYKKASLLSPGNAYIKHKVRMAEFQLDVRKNDDDSKAVGTSI